VKAVRARLVGVAVTVIAAVATTMAASAARAEDDSSTVGNSLHEQLTSYQETPLAISTGGTGVFRAHIDADAQTITYELSYSGLEGNITQAHIHFGARGQSGGISFFLCTNLGNGPAGTQACPAAPAAITGTITPADVIGPAGQGIAAGQFDEIVAAIRAGVAYVNIHTTLFPAGEIRSQFGH
jgi:CHRD domain